MNKVTFHAAITDTTTGTDLLTLTGGDPASAETGPAPIPATSSNTASGFTRLPMLRKNRRRTGRQHAPGTTEPP